MARFQYRVAGPAGGVAARGLHSQGPGACTCIQAQGFRLERHCGTVRSRLVWHQAQGHTRRGAQDQARRIASRMCGCHALPVNPDEGCRMP